MSTRTHIRRRSLALAAVLTGLCLTAGPAQAGFEPSFDVSPPGNTADSRVVTDPTGAAHFVWWRANVGLETRTRTPGGVLGQVHKLTSSGDDVQAAADAEGNVHFVWRKLGADPYVVQTRTLAADGTLGQTVDISAPGYSGYAPQLAVDPAGGVTFVWQQKVQTGWTIQARRMTPAGTLMPAKDLSAVGDADYPQVAVDHEGNAVFVWIRSDGFWPIAQARRWNGDGSVGPIKDLTLTGQAASAPQVRIDPKGIAHIAVIRGPEVLTWRMTPDGSLGPAHDVREAPSDKGSELDLAVNPDGGAQVTWTGVSAAGYAVKTRHELPNGSYGPVRTLAERAGSGGYQVPRVVFDGEGDAYHAWLSDAGGGLWRAVTRELLRDGSLAPLQELSTSGDARYIALAPSVSGHPIATWRVDTVKGAVVAPPRGEGGATTPPPGGGGGAETAAPLPDLVAPTLSGLALSPAKLRVGQRGRVDYSLSEIASISLRVARRGAGRRAGGRCARPTPGNRTRARCALFVRGSFGERGEPGRNRLNFPGRLRGRYLVPGRYVLVAVATDMAGNRSAPRRVGFRVVRGPR